MGLFTELGAALSYNVGGEDLCETQPEFAKEVFEPDPDGFEYYFLHKYGMWGKPRAQLIEYLKRYTNDLDNIPYDKIFENFLDNHIYGSKEFIDSTVKYYKEYLSVKNRKNEHENEEEINPVERAIQEIGNLLGLLEKKVKGNFGEEEEHSLKDNAERWREDISILRTYIEQEA